MDKKYVRYYLVTTQQKVEYVKLQSDEPFSIAEGKKNIKDQSSEHKDIVHIAKSKAEQFLQLQNAH